MSFSSQYQQRKYPPTSVNQPVVSREDDMVLNNAGGYGFKLTDEERVKRFLVLGADGTYYVSQENMRLENALVLVNFAKTNGVRLVQLVEEMNSTRPVSARKETSIFALAVAKTFGDIATLEAVNKCVRNKQVIMSLGQIEDYLLELQSLSHNTLSPDASVKAPYIPMGTGFKSALVDAIFTSPMDFAYQITKYRSRSRNGFSINTRDLLRLLRVNGDKLGEEYSWLIRYALTPYKSKPVKVDGVTPEQHERDVLEYEEKYVRLYENRPSTKATDYIVAFETVQVSQDVNEICRLIVEYRLPHECIPNTWFTDSNKDARVKIWQTLLPHMGMMALTRNVTRFARYGMFEDLKFRKLVIDKLSDKDAMLKAGIHPIQAFNAYYMYTKAVNLRSNEVWKVDDAVSNALEKAYMNSYGNVIPTNKIIALWLDTSGSMDGCGITNLSDMPLKRAGVVMALTIMNTEDNYLLRQFGSKTDSLPIDKGMSLARACQLIDKEDMGGTNIALPIEEMLQKKQYADAIIILTDSEGWEGRHSSEVFEEYRKKVNKNVKLIFVQMVGNHASVNDPLQLNAIEVIGFDGNTPSIISEFIRAD